MSPEHLLIDRSMGGAIHWDGWPTFIHPRLLVKWHGINWSSPLTFMANISIQNISLQINTTKRSIKDDWHDQPTYEMLHPLIIAVFFSLRIVNDEAQLILKRCEHKVLQCGCFLQIKAWLRINRGSPSGPSDIYEMIRSVYNSICGLWGFVGYTFQQRYLQHFNCM